VDLFYSYDGITWYTIATGSVGTSYPWIYPGGNTGNVTYVKVQESPALSINSFTEIGSTISAPELLSPINGTSSVSLTPTLSWSSIPIATSYRVQVATDAGFTTVVVDASGATTSYTPPGLSGVTTYYWRVNASNSSATSLWADPFNFTTAISVPSMPAITAPLNTGGEYVYSINLTQTPTITWTTSSYAASYEIQISENSDFSGVPLVDATGLIGNLWTCTTLLPMNTIIYIRIRATNVAGSSTWYTSGSYRIGNNTTPPAPTVTYPTDGETRVDPVNFTPTWACVHVNTYELQISTVSGFTPYTYTVLDESGILSTLTTTFYTTNVLTSNTQYYMRVRGVNTSGTGSFSSTIGFHT
jgi:hypothetical protein